MPMWLLIPIIAVAAIALFALVWWTSGRARGPASSLTQEQIERTSQFPDRQLGEPRGLALSPLMSEPLAFS